MDSMIKNHVEMITHHYFRHRRLEFMKKNIAAAIQAAATHPFGYSF